MIRLLAILATTLATALPVAAAPVQPRPLYRIEDLGVVAHTQYSQAFGVSPDGATVVGRALGNTGFPAFAWTAGGGMTGLPNIDGRLFAAANAANDAGVIVGTSATTSFGSGALPVQWVDGKVSRLPLPRGQDVGRANAINQAGVAVGSVNGDVLERAVIYEQGSATVIQAKTGNGSYMAYALGIDDEGHVGGGGIDPNDAALNVGLVYDRDGDTLTDVGALPGMNGALVFGIANGGYAVGSSMLNQGSGMPFVWTAQGGMVAIPLPPHTSEGISYGVNDRGWTVGVAGGAYAVPFLYMHGRTYALANLIAPGSGWDLDHNTSSSALAITHDGTIVGTAVHHGKTHAYRMRRIHLPN